MVGSIPQPGDPYPCYDTLMCTSIAPVTAYASNSTVSVSYTFETIDPYNGKKGLRILKTVPAPSRTTLRTFTLAPRTPAYVWGIVALLVLGALAWAMPVRVGN